MYNISQFSKIRKNSARKTKENFSSLFGGFRATLFEKLKRFQPLRQIVFFVDFRSLCIYWPKNFLGFMKIIQLFCAFGSDTHPPSIGFNIEIIILIKCLYIVRNEITITCKK